MGRAVVRVRQTAHAQAPSRETENGGTSERGAVLD